MSTQQRVKPTDEQVGSLVDLAASVLEGLILINQTAEGNTFTVGGNLDRGQVNALWDLLAALEAYPSREPTDGEKVCQELRILGIQANWEYPGFVCIPTSNPPACITVGQDDGQWLANTLDDPIENECVEMALRDGLSPQETAKAIFETVKTYAEQRGWSLCVAPVLP